MSNETLAPGVQARFTAFISRFAQEMGLEPIHQNALERGLEKAQNLPEMMEALNNICFLEAFRASIIQGDDVNKPVPVLSPLVAYAPDKKKNEIEAIEFTILYQPLKADKPQQTMISSTITSEGVEVRIFNENHILGSPEGSVYQEDEVNLILNGVVAAVSAEISRLVVNCTKATVVAFKACNQDPEDIAVANAMLETLNKKVLDVREMPFAESALLLIPAFFKFLDKVFELGSELQDAHISLAAECASNNRPLVFKDLGDLVKKAGVGDKVMLSGFLRGNENYGLLGEIPLGDDAGRKFPALHFALGPNDSMLAMDGGAVVIQGGAAKEGKKPDVFDPKKMKEAIQPGPGVSEDQAQKTLTLVENALRAFLPMTKDKNTLRRVLRFVRRLDNT